MYTVCTCMLQQLHTVQGVCLQSLSVGGLDGPHRQVDSGKGCVYIRVKIGIQYKYISMQYKYTQYEVLGIEVMHMIVNYKTFSDIHTIIHISYNACVYIIIIKIHTHTQILTHILKLSYTSIHNNIACKEYTVSLTIQCPSYIGTRHPFHRIQSVSHTSSAAIKGL